MNDQQREILNSWNLPEAPRNVLDVMRVYKLGMATEALVKVAEGVKRDYRKKWNL